MTRFIFIIISCVILLSMGKGHAQSPEPTSITLNWTAPGDDGDVGQATTYDIRYSLEPITEANWNDCTQASNPPAPQPAGSVESFTIGGLDPSTLYYFAIKTGDEAGNWSGLSNIAMVETIDNIPPGAINDLTATPGE